MSLILDALRKSEAERRRGQAPSLYAEAPVPSTRHRPAWMPLLPVAFGVLVLVGVATYWFRDDAPVTKQELVEEADEPSPVPRIQTAGAPATAAPPPAAKPAPLPVAPASAATPSVDALVKTPPAAVPAQARTPALAPAPPVTPAPAAPSAASATPAAPAEEALPPLAVLDPSMRSSLPPMKLSMHVYTIDPARRFAILDGQRVTEGSQIGAAIVLEIRRDGVVLDVAGKRVLLPRP
jgi:general secretion pathway protein B